MGKQNVGLLAWNRGLIDSRALARVDLDRTRLSAEVMTNWLPKSQGEMTIRPGTKYLGSSYNDTGAFFIEFVARTDDTALLELTDERVRVWVPSDTGNYWETPVQSGVYVPLSRPLVDTTVSLSDTGWEDNSTGGVVVTDPVDVIPTMTAATTNGVTITASSQNVVEELYGVSSFAAWKIGDNNTSTAWCDTGFHEDTSLPSWVNVDFGASDPKTILSYSVRCGPGAGQLDNAPSAWRLIGSNYDTGTYATDTGKWTLEDERTGITSWSVSERKIYTLTDTGTADAWRHWRLYVTDTVGGGDESNELQISELELFESAPASQVVFNAGALTLNATTARSRAAISRHIEWKVAA